MWGSLTRQGCSRENVEGEGEGARAQMLEQDVFVTGAFSFCSLEELECRKIEGA
jgi:hypothetical protein